MRMLFPILALAVAGCTSLPEGVTLSLAPEAPTTTDPLVATLSGDLGDPEKITWTFTWTFTRTSTRTSSIKYYKKD